MVEARRAAERGGPGLGRTRPNSVSQNVRSDYTYDDKRRRRPSVGVFRSKKIQRKERTPPLHGVELPKINARSAHRLLVRAAGLCPDCVIALRRSISSMRTDVSKSLGFVQFVTASYSPLQPSHTKYVGAQHTSLHGRKVTRISADLPGSPRT